MKESSRGSTHLELVRLQGRYNLAYDDHDLTSDSSITPNRPDLHFGQTVDHLDHVPKSNLDNSHLQCQVPLTPTSRMSLASDNLCNDIPSGLIDL